MDRDHEIRSEIRRHFRNRLSCEKTLIKICDKFANEKLEFDQVCQWFKDSNTSTRYPNDTIRELLTKVVHEYGKLQYAIAFWPENIGRFEFLNSRYAISYDKELLQGRFSLLDNFHGEKRLICIDGAFPTINNPPWRYYLEVIDSEFLLLFETHYDLHEIYDDPVPVHIRLLRLDIAQSRCTFLETKDFYVHFDYDFIFDCNNRRCFAMHDCSSLSPIWFARIVQNSLVIDPPIVTELWMDGRYLRLDGNKIQILKRTDTNATLMEFGEFEITDGHKNPPNKTLCNLKIVGKFCDNSLFQWHRNNCYIVAFDEDPTKNLMLFVIDLQTGLITSTSYSIFLCKQFCGISFFNIDERKCAMALQVKEPDGTTVIYRLPLNEPDTLVNLSFLKLRRDALFFGDTFYKSLLSNLPSNLKPFGSASLQCLPGFK